MKSLSKHIAIILFTLIGISSTYAGPARPPPDSGAQATRKVILLHGLFARGNTLLGGPTFPDLPGWIQNKTGYYPPIPDMGTGDFESQYQIVIRAMNADCPNCRWHMVGHSRGGLVARMVMERHPEKVASITQIGSPNRGCSLCDRARTDPSMYGFLQIFGTHSADQIVEMSQYRMNQFNQRFPAGVPNGVGFCQRHGIPHDYFYSHLYVRGYKIHAAAFVGDRFGSTWEEFEAFWPNIPDPTYLGLRILGAIGARDRNYSYRNDGVVAACSAAFGAKGTEGKILGAVDHNDMAFQLVRMSTTRGIDNLKNHLTWLWDNAY